MRLNKLEIAERQFDVAADLFFADSDPCAVLTLAGAAEEISGILVRQQGNVPMFDHLVALDKRLTGGRPIAVVVKEVNGVRNSLKHANDPHEKAIDIDECDALAMLARAFVNLGLLRVAPTFNMFRVYRHLATMHRGGAA